MRVRVKDRYINSAKGALQRMYPESRVSVGRFKAALDRKKAFEYVREGDGIVHVMYEGLSVSFDHEEVEFISEIPESYKQKVIDIVR